ncbi:hypothetical protein Bca4012_094543 [Brassica carinata]|uniref:DUF7054 domain-containing protein n=3 Tax=Brassica TaxID=3705 RepID=A0A0D3DR05_BRAOL|nr:PREDICTED: uncharacterized protein At4g22758-like [Brassica oleracea var. oleracea]KAG2257361.1 hypothetical protein Bca52824_076655 [Brassica carinata]VDD56585.1 unnamed protein product [Brassica oleracea]
MLMYNKQKKKKRETVTIKGNRILISVAFLGSAGPIRFVAYEGDLVANVIDTALKCYAREGRLPVLGSDFNDFLFYCPMVGPEALSPWEAIGSLGARNFMLCEKPEEEEKKKVEEEDSGRSSFPINGARKRSFRAWINKSFSLKVTTH